MKRTPLHRHTELQRRSFLRAVNPERKARRKEAGEVYGPYYAWTTEQPCALAGKTGHRCYYVPERGREAHHVRSVGAGGKDAANILPLCSLHHDLAHSLGAQEIKRRRWLDLKAEAVALYRRSPFYREEAA